MKNIKLYYLLLIFVLVSACKENPSDLPAKTDIHPDSVFFVINGKTFVFNQRNTSGIGNRQINVKPSQTLLIGRDFEYHTGNLYWYGEKDSTLYDAFYKFRSEKENNTIQISFSKKLNNSQLSKSFTMFVPADNSALFKQGKQGFAVDLNMENTMDGISVEAGLEGISKQLSSYIPGFSILERTSLGKNIQDNSNFEITKVQKLDDKYMLIEAKFELNLFDDKGKLYRLEKGFLRFKTITTVVSAFEAT